MEIPDKAKKLLDLIYDFSKLENSDRVVIPLNEIIKAGIETNYWDVFSDFLLRNKFINNYHFCEGAGGNLSLNIRAVDELMKKDFFMDGFMDPDLSNHVVVIYDLPNKKDLTNSSAKFLEKESTLIINNKRIEIPPLTNQSNLCKIMFSKAINEIIDWSEVYDDITGLEADYTDSNRKTIYDAMKKVNERIASFGFEKLFVWSDKTIKRIY